MKRLDLNLMVALEALLLTRSVSLAARKVGVGQPAMSASLARIRRLFDDPILVRGPGGMVPTPRARLLEEPLRHALAELREMLEPPEAFDPATSQRRFRICGGDYVGMVLLPPVLAAMETIAPGVDLRLRFIEKDRVLACLDSDEIDLAFCVNDSPPPRFRCETLFEEDFVCVARRGHPLFAGPLTPQAFARQRHLLFTERGDERGVIDDVLAGMGLSRRIVLTVPQASLVSHALRTTDLVAAVGRRVAERLAGGWVESVELPFAVETWRMSMMSAVRREGDAGLQWLRALVLAALADQAHALRG